MDIGLHHYGGPVHLESSRYYSDITNKFLAGAKEIGLKEIDVNGKNPLGFGKLKNLLNYLCKHQFVKFPNAIKLILLHHYLP